MSPCVCCTLCGWFVLADWDPDSSETWAHQFRALYSGPEGLLLTGVACDNPNTGVYAASLDRNARWSDAGYDEAGETDFAVLVDPGFRGRRGFIFHDACWNILEAALHPIPVPLQRLLDVCSSLPTPRACRAPNWGHDFGGIVIVDNTHHFPWEERYHLRAFPEPDPVFSKNPYQVPGVDRILVEDPDPEQPPTFSQAVPSSQTLRTDCFASLDSLPEELCTIIAMYLPTIDVLRARLASRAFWPVFYNQQFWASRFRASTERSWLFEARKLTSPRDWRWLYRRTNDDAHIGPGLRNRRRIWGLLQGVLDILDLVWNELPPDLPSVWSPDPALCTTGHRVEATGHLWSDAQLTIQRFKFHNGCHQYRAQSIAVPDALARLSVFTLAFGDGEYIVGMSLTTAAGDTIRLGYRSPSEHSVQLSQLWGFRLAMGSRGLQALQCITGPTDSNAPPWLGSPLDVPQTERLVAADRVVGLEVGFDGCKMVSIALHTRSPPPGKTLQLQSRLRHSGVWYPTIPPQNLCLNEETFPRLDFHVAGYRPLFWCHFGGPGGKYLPHLTGISAAVGLDITLLRISFSFDKEVPAEHRSFGRLKGEAWESVTNFSIDGPGGERINAIKTRQFYPDPAEGLEWMAQEGPMIQCKLYTNRGRLWTILNSPRYNCKGLAVGMKFKAAPGAAITGLYATELPEEEHGITAMGAMTEDTGDAEE